MGNVFLTHTVRKKRGNSAVFLHYFVLHMYILGASLSEPHLVESMAALSVRIFIYLVVSIDTDLRCQ